MKFRELIKALDNIQVQTAGSDFLVKGISCNSRELGDNFVFVAIKGNLADGHRFIKEAIAKGAKAVVVQSTEIRHQDLKRAIFLGVKDTRIALARLAAAFYGKPTEKMKIVGITGTNGKTTISYLLEAILKEQHIPPVVLGTVNYRFKDKVIPAKNTTPGPLEIQSLLAQARKAGLNYVVMEVSSHALQQGRIAGINFHSAIFTNLTQDHLDYHANIENYFLAKSKLFSGLSASALAVINQDDAYAVRLKALTRAKIITYGIKVQSEIMAKEIKFSLKGTRFLLVGRGCAKLNIKTQLIGVHNVYNILACLAWAKGQGLNLTSVKSAIEKFSCVPGRLERVGPAADFGVFVDYAHTEDALKNVISSLRKVSRGKIIVVFGCGGDRDKKKRPKMGRVVTDLADFAVITNDNPRSEDPRQIIKEICAGIKHDNYCVVPDRKEAIKKSLSLIKPTDIVLVAGKGHEHYQVFKEKVVHFDDRLAVKECLKLMN